MMRALRKYRPEGARGGSEVPLLATSVLAGLPELWDFNSALPVGEMPAASIADLQRQLRARHGGSHIIDEGTRLPLPKAWQFLCLAEIANFSPLRRHLGRSRADHLPIDVS